MIDRVPPGGKSSRLRTTFRDVAFEWVNTSKTQTHRFVSMTMEQPPGLWNIEVGPGEAKQIPDKYYRIHTSDGLTAQGEMNHGDARRGKRGKRKWN